MEILSQYWYPLVITSFFGVLFLFLRYKIQHTQKQRLQSLERRKIRDAVVTDSPVENQNQALKEIAIEGLEDRFSFVLKLLPFTMVSLWVTAMALPHLGEVPTVYVSILAAILSVVVGVSLRPFLENLFSGIVITFSRSIRVGDNVIIDGEYGLIEEIGLTYSVLKRWDWYRIVIPNSRLLQKEIQSLTMRDSYIWAHVEFFVAPGSDLKKVEEVAIKAATESHHFNRNEEPSFWVMDLHKDTIRCWLAAWADTPNEAWELRNDMRLRINTELQKLNIQFHQFNTHSYPVG